jgi:hypothetical protein
VVGVSILGMHNTKPCCCFTMVRSSKYVWLHRASMSFLMLLHLILKNSIQMTSLLGALLQAPLLTTAFTCTSVMGVSRKSLHPSGKFLNAAYSIRVNLASPTWKHHICLAGTQYISQNAQVSVCVTPSFSVMLVIISVTHRFRNFRRCKGLNS